MFLHIYMLLKMHSNAGQTPGTAAEGEKENCG